MARTKAMPSPAKRILATILFVFAAILFFGIV